MSDSARPHRRQPTRLPRPWDSPGKNTGVGCHFLLQCMKVKSQSEVTQLCPTLSDPMDCSPPGSSVHGIFQARVLESGAIAFSMTVARKGLILGWRWGIWNQRHLHLSSIDHSIYHPWSIDLIFLLSPWFLLFELAVTSSRRKLESMQFFPHRFKLWLYLCLKFSI